MKVFVATLTVAAALVLGWHYWVVLRPKPLPEPAPTQGVYRAVGPGASARSVPSGPHSALNVIVSLAGGGTHSAHVELIRFTQQGRPFSYASDEALGDGRVTFPRVAADRYWVVAQTDLEIDGGGQADGQTVSYYGATEVATDGLRPAQVAVRLRAAGSLTGDVGLAPAGVAQIGDIGLFNVTLTPADTATRAIVWMAAPSVPIDADGQFRFTDVPPGRYQLTLDRTPWTLDGVVIGDRDRLDLPFQIGPAERLRARVTLAERPTVLGGVLRDAAGRPRPLGLVAVFAVDADSRESVRRVQLSRADARGRFSFHGLPSGEYLLAPADGFDPTLWYMPQFFDRLTGRATRVALGRGGRRTQDVRAPERP